MTTEPTLLAADTAVLLGPGSTIGSYKILKQIGRGGMGLVFEAVHTMLSRHVAIKVLHPELIANTVMSARLSQEAAILEELHHPGIIRIFDCGRLEDQRPWIAMELMTGNNLAAKIDREMTLSPTAACELVTLLADVLATAHERGIVHRDLKPDNILFADSDHDCPVRVIDWGVASIAAAPRLTVDGLTYGTPSYMSPEQIVGKNITSASDVYALGVIAFEMLAGHLPFTAGTVLEVVSLHIHAEIPLLGLACPAAPVALCDLVHRMMSKAAWQRPTAAEVRDAMRAIAADVDDQEFESYDLTMTQQPAPTVERLGQLRWTPQLPALVPTANGSAMVRPNRTCHTVSGEFDGPE